MPENTLVRKKCEPKKDEVGNLGYYKYIMRNFMLYVVRLVRCRRHVLVHTCKSMHVCRSPQNYYYYYEEIY